MKKQPLFPFLLALAAATNCAFSQDTIRLLNPSFERIANNRKEPEDWERSAVALYLPSLSKERDSQIKPKDGAFCIKFNSSSFGWSGLQQKLSKPLLRDSVYAFQCYLAYDDACELEELFRRNPKKKPCTGLSHLALIGLNSKNEQMEYLAMTDPVGNSQWLKHRIYFKPQEGDYDEIRIIALLGTEQNSLYGNLYVDRCSPITLIPAHKTHDLGEFAGLSRSKEKADSSRIKLSNPSFEEERFLQPDSWTYFFVSKEGAEMSNRMDTSVIFHEGQLDRISVFNLEISNKASNGEGFGALRASKDNIWQGIAQYLGEIGLLKDSTYRFSVDLALAKKYKGLNFKEKMVSFPNPLRLKIWGINADNTHKELLAETAAVLHHEWKRYDFEFKPKDENCRILFLEACYLSDLSKPYDGNLLLDNCSMIEKISGH